MHLVIEFNAEIVIKQELVQEHGLKKRSTKEWTSFRDICVIGNIGHRVLGIILKVRIFRKKIHN